MNFKNDIMMALVYANIDCALIDLKPLEKGTLRNFKNARVEIEYV